MLRRAFAPSAVLLKGFAPGSGVSVALCTCWQSPKQTSADRIAINIVFRFFITYFYLSVVFWPSLTFPAAPPAREIPSEEPRTRGARATHGVSFLAVYSFLQRRVVAKVLSACQDKRKAFREFFVAVSRKPEKSLGRAAVWKNTAA